MDGDGEADFDADVEPAKAEEAELSPGETADAAVLPLDVATDDAGGEGTVEIAEIDPEEALADAIATDLPAPDFSLSPPDEPRAEAEPDAAAAGPEPERDADAAPASEGPDPIDAVLLELERLTVRVEELTRLSTRHMEHIDRLHAENQQLRAGELRQAMSPVLRSLIRHHDDLAKLSGTAEEGSPEAVSLGIVRSGLLNVLSLAGVEAFDVSANEPFDPARHQGVSRASTDNPELDGTVAQMRRCGFVAEDGRVIRPAEVDVYRVG